MLISKYDKFVQETDQSKDLPLKERKEIAIYGLGSEIGSVASAIKKRLLHEDGKQAWNAPNLEIEEELGDVMWYCFALARLENAKRPLNILIHDINNLRNELASENPRSELIRGVIGTENRQAFLDATESFRRNTREMSFSEYQSVAYLTARTEGKTLVEVCVAVLYQLSAELFRFMLPEIERKLNNSLPDRPFNDVLGEIAWHTAALASIYNLDLNSVAQANLEKVSFRQDKSHPVIVHDLSFPDDQRFPRKFEISFVTVGKGKAQMYWQGKRLGDQLTDNSYDDDGYRFHDVMHLANIAHLGWSPVMRGLMGRKRKLDRQTDEVEDGARAKIVEEAVIKTIHAEGVRLAGHSSDPTAGPVRLFPNLADIPYKFLKQVRSLVFGLEVSKNRIWEWENSVVEGYDAYHRLRVEGQGTVVVDLDERSLEFQPHVYIPLAGRVVGFGTASVGKRRSDPGPLQASDLPDPARLDAKVRAVLASLGFSSPSADDLDAVSVVELHDNEISVRATGAVRNTMWERKVVAFRVTATDLGGHWICNALALSDD